MKIYFIKNKENKYYGLHPLSIMDSNSIIMEDDWGWVEYRDRAALAFSKKDAFESIRSGCIYNSKLNKSDYKVVSITGDAAQLIFIKYLDSMKCRCGG